MKEKETKAGKKMMEKKNPAGAFDQYAKHSTWNLLTGCYDPFIQPETDDDKTSAISDSNKDTHDSDYVNLAAP